MKFNLLRLQNLLSLVSIFSLNLAISLPAKAAISCEGMISYYSNGSLANCLLSQNLNLQVTSSLGIYKFPCKARSYIFFDQQGQFQRCQLSEDIQIKTGNSVESCPADYWIHFKMSEAGNPSINCQPY